MPSSMLADLQKIQGGGNSETHEKPPKSEKKQSDLFKSSYMKQFAVKRAERPPMPASVVADLQKMNGSTDKLNDSLETPTAVTRTTTNYDKPPIFITSVFKQEDKFIHQSQKISKRGQTSDRTKELAHDIPELELA
jgi:hypothetical protein